MAFVQTVHLSAQKGFTAVVRRYCHENSYKYIYVVRIQTAKYILFGDSTKRHPDSIVVPKIKMISLLR